MYEGYHFLGMHLGWWFIWLIIIFWVFASPYAIPGQRAKSLTALDILNYRLTQNEITKTEYLEIKKLITRF
ncbi:MAG: putative membrane protein [Marinoscillum sp.]|jgi:putative membrane protein